MRDICSVMQVRQFDEEKLESRIQKLKDSLFVHDPQLAQLVKLNSTGTTDVEQDTERQLMSVTVDFLLPFQFYCIGLSRYIAITTFSIIAVIAAFCRISP